MNKKRSFAIWILEMLFESVGTTLWIAVLAIIQNGLDHGHDSYPYGYLGLLFGISAVVLLEFALTGYLVTTLLSAQFLPRRGWFYYPTASFVLYLVHSEIFLVGAGNPPIDGHSLLIQIGGASIAFALTLAGDRFRIPNYSSR